VLVHAVIVEELLPFAQNPVLKIRLGAGMVRGEGEAAGDQFCIGIGPAQRAGDPFQAFEVFVGRAAPEIEIGFVPELIEADFSLVSRRECFDEFLQRIGIGGALVPFVPVFGVLDQLRLCRPGGGVGDHEDVFHPVLAVECHQVVEPVEAEFARRRFERFPGVTGTEQFYSDGGGTLGLRFPVVEAPVLLAHVHPDFELRIMLFRRPGGSQVGEGGPGEARFVPGFVAEREVAAPDAVRRRFRPVGCPDRLFSRFQFEIPFKPAFRAGEGIQPELCGKRILFRSEVVKPEFRRVPDLQDIGRAAGVEAKFRRVDFAQRFPLDSLPEQQFRGFRRRVLVDDDIHQLDREIYFSVFVLPPASGDIVGEIPDDPVFAGMQRFLAHGETFASGIRQFECQIDAGAAPHFDIEGDRIGRSDILQPEHDLLHAADHRRLAGFGNLPGADQEAFRRLFALQPGIQAPLCRIVEFDERTDDADHARFCRNLRRAQ